MRTSWLTILGTVLVAASLVWGCTPSSSRDRGDPDSDGTGTPGSDGGPSGGGDTGTGGTFGGGDGMTKFVETDADLPPSNNVGSDACASRRVNITRKPIDVIVIVDQSYSMSEGFGNGGSKWSAVRNALLSQPNGVITQLEGIVRFGLVLYTTPGTGGGGSWTMWIPGVGGSDGGTGMCPQLTTVNTALNNRDTIANEFDNAMPLGQTPTGNALKQVIDQLNLPMDSPDQNVDRPVFLLATDGEPDTCSNPDAEDDGSGEGVPAVVQQVSRAYDMGIETFLLDVGDNVSQSTKQQVANAGVGKAAGASPGADFWTANDPMGLQQAIVEIVGGQVSCEIELAGEIQNISDACSAGTVTLDGQEVPCGPDGWEATDASHIKLVGQACDELRSNPDVQVQASFECGTLR